jgi:HEAT repeat protein
LIGLLNDPDESVQESARYSLWLIGDAAIEALIARLNDAEAAVRWQAVQALREIGGKEAEEALRRFHLERS